MLAKFWLGPVRLGRIERVVAEHETVLLEAWNEYFAD